ncbi:D-alanyl-D-alanine carboxypeptidase [Patescibacteria group bacterium]|nr:D-alanyl-D-alanine carboxypeptidase [Patescibacteria group bacterium]
MKLRILALFFFLLFGLGEGSFASAALVPTANFQGYVRASDEFAAAVVMVPGTHQILYQYEAETPRVAASLTKLVNALVFVRLAPAWNKIVALQKSDEVGGGRLRVASGARLSIKDLFYSSITASANNAAMALSRISGLSPAKYFQEMNRVAKTVGATHSHFVDASGMDPRNITTALDMAYIAEKAFQDPMIHRVSTAGSYAFTIRNTGEKKRIHNTNILLTEDPDVWVTGGKTGYLEESMYNLVVELRPMNADGSFVPGKDLVVVVLGAPTKANQFTSAKRLAQWAWQQYEFPSTQTALR